MRKLGFGLLVLIIALAIPVISCDDDSSEPSPVRPQTDDTPIAPPPAPPTITPIAPPPTPVP